MQMPTYSALKQQHILLCLVILFSFDLHRNKAGPLFFFENWKVGLLNLFFSTLTKNCEVYKVQ